ncbi:unnamed protein product [Ranitomeya imitator]|uniref:Chromo domain-containing protein n=1 Tax=Ranitomeya imitator TaxID=111125 RepID=A0ABN9LWB2_9NEOB|nr:unnamed protein product [Ranitomeya imitator]
MVPSVEPPAPVLVEGELEYIVEKILDSRVSRRKLQYLVKWKACFIVFSRLLEALRRRGTTSVPLVEKILTPYIEKTPSFLLDPDNFLRGIRDLGPVPKNSNLVTLDVKDLYSSIPHTQGIECVRHLLMSTKMVSEKVQFCLELLTLVLTKNYFLLED